MSERVVFDFYQTLVNQPDIVARKVEKTTYTTNKEFFRAVAGLRLKYKLR